MEEGYTASSRRHLSDRLAGRASSTHARSTWPEDCWTGVPSVACLVGVPWGVLSRLESGAVSSLREASGTTAFAYVDMSPRYTSKKKRTRLDPCAQLRAENALIPRRGMRRLPRQARSLPLVGYSGGREGFEIARWRRLTRTLAVPAPFHPSAAEVAAMTSPERPWRSPRGTFHQPYHPLAGLRNRFGGLVPIWSPASCREHSSRLQRLPRTQSSTSRRIFDFEGLVGEIGQGEPDAHTLGAD